jgi:polysaccharide export outer membrane protein
VAPVLKEKAFVAVVGWCVLTVLGCSLLFAQEARRLEDLRLIKGDTVRLEVPQREDLNRYLTIDNRGMVSLPIVGSVRLEGLTMEEAKGTLLRALQEIYPSTQSITLTFIGEKTRRSVYVQGQVWQPGRYDIEGLSNVWDAIKEAGGPTSSGSIEAVRLIRTEGDRSTTTVVNVQRALASGDIASVPALKPGDTIIVPDRTGSYVGSGAVNIIGAVFHPASYLLPEDKRLSDAILIAGGSSENANLKKVRILRVLPDGSTRNIEVNFKRYLNTGDLAYNPVILPNDTVNVPRNSSWSVVSNPTFLLGLITASASVVALWISITR